jgi:hypothetical protein
MVVALDDCTISVAMAPQSAPRIGVAAALARTVRSDDPANAFRPSVMTVMPSKNRPTPPRMEIVVDIRAPYLRTFGYSSVTGITQSPRLRLAGKLRACGGQFFFHFVVDFWK